MTALVNTLAGYVGGGASSPEVINWNQGGQTVLQGGSGGGFDIKKILETGTSFASAGLSIFGANRQADYLQSDALAKAQGYALQAQQSTIEAKQAQIEGQQKSNQILDNLVQTIATQRLNFSGNGVDPTFGTPGAVARSSQKIANRQLSVTRGDAQQLALSRRAQSASYLAQGAAATASGNAGAAEVLLKGYASAGGTVSDYWARRMARG